MIYTNIFECCPNISRFRGGGAKAVGVAELFDSIISF